jgi:hypothetical protein
MPRPDRRCLPHLAQTFLLTLCLSGLPLQSVLAQSPLTDPDEGGIGGTGHRPERVEVPERPELPDVPDLPERIELPDSPHEALDTQGGVTPPDIPDTPDRPEGRP